MCAVRQLKPTDCTLEFSDWCFSADRAGWPLQCRQTMDRTITVINCNDWWWEWVCAGLWRGWGPHWPNLEGRRAACRPQAARVIVPMCSAPGHIPWGTVHTGGHLKAYLDVAAIRVRTSTQGSNLFQLLECARGWRNGDENMRVCGCVWGEVGGLRLNLDKVMVSHVATWLHRNVQSHRQALSSPTPVHILDTTSRFVRRIIKIPSATELYFVCRLPRTCHGW